MSSYGSVTASGNGADEALASEASLHANFFRMELCFGVLHGVCTTPLVVASSLMGANNAYIGNGILFVAALVGSLVLAAPVSAHLGNKNALLVGSGLYVLYVGGFGFALTLPSSPIPWFLASVSGGAAGAILWTAQGGYFAETATKLSTITGESREKLTASLAASFSFWYLVLELAAKLGFSGLQRADIPVVRVVALYTAIGVVALAVLFGLKELKPGCQEATVNVVEKVGGVISLWRDPNVWLLSFTNFTFGFAAAFMNGYVNGQLLTAELGANMVAAVAAVTPLTAALLSKVFGALAHWTGKGPIIAFGSVSFLSIPLTMLVFGCCAGWGAGVIFLYVLQGLGRAVYESTNRALFADFFSRRSEDAFANCALQSNAAFAASFFLQASLSKEGLAGIIVALSVATPIGHFVASMRGADRAKEPLA